MENNITSSVETYLSEHELVTKLEYNSDEQRMEQLFAEIERQKDIIKYLSKHHKLSSKDKIIAILVRDNWQIHNILEEAKVRGEFIETHVGGDLYQLIPALDLYKLVIALLNPRDPVNLFNLIDSNYVGIQLDIQGLHGLGTEEQVKRLTDVLNQYFTTVMNTTWEKIIMDTRVQPILMLLRSIYEGCQPWYQYSNTDSEQRFYKANYELVLEKIIKTYSVDYLTLNVIEHSMHINVMTKQEELARNIEVETDDIRVICTTVHKAKGLEYGCVIMAEMGLLLKNIKIKKITEEQMYLVATYNASGLLEVDIEDDKDVYNQKNVFKTAYATIDAILSENDRFKEFKDKLQNSTLLVLIKDIDSTNSDAVEQIFLDINEKSKRLDNASIFKGYCFKIYDEAFQDELKCLWIRLKKAYISFKNFSGENYKFDEYIYMYLLVTEDENMTENLSPGGIHFLEDKNMDDVERILTKMVEYGERVSDFYKHIQNEAYIFEDICVDSNSYKTASKKLITNVKEYLLYSMETKSAQYQKVPLNWFIYFVKDKSNNMNILMKDFMTITANLYIYSFLFTLSPSKKSKKNIDHSLYNVLNEDVDIKQIINIVKELRKKQVENVQIPENCRSFDVLSNLYTIMDCFKVKENRFDVTYHNHGGQLYTLEHFIVPDNRNAKIKWLTKDEESIEISFTGQSERKKKLINYLIVEQKLNNDILLDFDVIKKIELISDYYGNATPKHVGIITAHIENMESYKELKKLKNEEDEKEVENIRNCYNSFLDEYFSDNNQRTILNKLLEGLKLTFINS